LLSELLYQVELLGIICSQITQENAGVPTNQWLLPPLEYRFCWPWYRTSQVCYIQSDRHDDYAAILFNEKLSVATRLKI
jgi:hypothetical protein